MADTLYAWNPFSGWVISSVTSESYQLLDGSTWTPSASYTQVDSQNIRTITLSDATQTKVSGGRTYTATFDSWTISYSGTYLDWSSRVSELNESVSVNHATEYKTTPSPYTAGTLRLKANWTITSEPTPTNYTVTTAASPVAGGTTTGDGQYAYGSTCILSATPANGYEFVRWVLSTGATPTSRDYSFPVTQDTTATAYFRQYTNMLLHGSSNTLLHGSSGTLLHDA